MEKNTPFSYVVRGGVTNVNTRVNETGTLHELHELFSDPVELSVTVDAYHAASKKEKTAWKRPLPYFVGGVLDGKRDDHNVRERTLITLDIERNPKKQDEEPPPPEDVVRALRDTHRAGWVYTSIGHLEDSPRYRVVLPLEKPLRVDDVAQAQADLQATTLAAAADLGLEEWCTPESWVLSQAMYAPARLRAGPYYSRLVRGAGWLPVRGKPGKAERKEGRPADIPDERPDFVLLAIKAAGLYLRPNDKHKGMHFIKCPLGHLHGAENDTQTVYYEAHFDGNPRAAVKCFDTEPDENGVPHLTFNGLVRWLKKEGHLTQDQQESTGVLDDYDTFLQRADLGRLLDSQPVPREWAIKQFAPVGKVTVVAGPGGVSKSMLVLHILVHAALGQSWGAFRVDQPLRSLYVSYEDDTQELHGRVHALSDALARSGDGVLDALYDVKGSVRRNLLMFAADEEAASWLILTKPDRYEPAARTERVDWLVGFLKHAGIRMLVLDPAVYTHQLEENNIADMATYMQTLTYVAKQANCAVVVLHHMNKSGGWAQLDDISQGALRGASSFADNARSVMVVVSMPVKDAADYGLDPEHATTGRYAVVKHVKHNYSAPLPTQVFERDGPLLVHRPEISKLDPAAIAEARDQQKQQVDQTRMLMQVPRILQCCVDHDGAISQAQIAHSLNTKPARLKPALQWAMDNDLLEIEQAEGTGKSHRITITREGKSYLRNHLRSTK